jgi:hypothetical protein
VAGARDPAPFGPPATRRHRSQSPHEQRGPPPEIKGVPPPWPQHGGRRRVAEAQSTGRLRPEHEVARARDLQTTTTRSGGPRSELGTWPRSPVSSSRSDPWTCCRPRPSMKTWGRCCASSGMSRLVGRHSSQRASSIWRFEIGGPVLPTRVHRPPGSSAAAEGLRGLNSRLPLAKLGRGGLPRARANESPRPNT